MRKLLTGLLVSSIAGFVLLADACGEKSEHHKGKCCEWKKDAKVEISNIENGVIVKIISNKSEIVELIQKHAAKREKCHKSGKCPKECSCKHKKSSAECKKRHKLMKEAKIDVTNISNGVILKIASDKPEVVKTIQEYARKWKECKSKHKKGFSECEKKHETGERHH